MLLRIDTYVLERLITPFAHWFEYKTGRTNFYLAWWALGFTVLLWIFRLGIQISVLKQYNIVNLVIGSVMIFGCSILILILGHKDDQIRANPAAGAGIFVDDQQRSVLRGMILVYSVVLIVLTCIGLGFNAHSMPEIANEASHSLSMCTFTLYAYFTSVKRPPPKPRREEKEVKGLEPAFIRN